MAAHPEWMSWWERADQITEAEVLTPDGVDPYLAIIRLFQYLLVGIVPWSIL
jgi:hypothetical protein